jgi:membrane-bound metal-dependent hydrolase YbcI (DUF457 family)
MAGFRTHITTSTALGLAYGGTAAALFDVPWPRCALAAGLCGVSGMLPDLDSDSGVPLRESIAFAAAVVPMLMIPRFRTMYFTPETMVLAGAGIYLLIRFGLAWLLKKYTVHRGMFHSLPAALIAAEVAFLICSRQDLSIRYFFAAAVLVGFLSHLVLDEIWSVGFRRGHFYLKSSFGTALKLWGPNGWGNLSTYLKVVVLSFLVLHDPVWMYDGARPGEELYRLATEALQKVWQ